MYIAIVVPQNRTSSTDLYRQYQTFTIHLFNRIYGSEITFFLQRVLW